MIVTYGFWLCNNVYCICMCIMYIVALQPLGGYNFIVRGKEIHKSQPFQPRVAYHNFQTNFKWQMVIPLLLGFLSGVSLSWKWAPLRQGCHECCLSPWSENSTWVIRWQQSKSSNQVWLTPAPMILFPAACSWCCVSQIECVQKPSSNCRFCAKENLAAVFSH